MICLLRDANEEGVVAMKKVKMFIKKAVIHKPKKEMQQLKKEMQNEELRFNYFKRIKDFSVLTAQEEKELFDRVKAGDQNARTEVINANLKLVISIAKTYHAAGMRLEDWIQEGNIALLKAVEKFNPDLGFKFSTYATTVIEKHLYKVALRNKGMLSVSQDVAKEINQLEAVASRLKQTRFGEPSAKEIAVEMNVSEKRVEELQNISKRIKAQSIDAPVDEENDTTIGELQAAPQSISERAKEELDDLTEKISSSLVKKAVMLFFAKETSNPEELDIVYTDIGKELDITGERARQIITSYFEYERNHKNEKRKNGEGAKALKRLMVSSHNGIGTGHTVDVYSSLKNWSEIDGKNHAMKNWEAFYHSQNTIEMLQNIACTDFHIYFVRYLLERFSNVLPEMTAEEVYQDAACKALLVKCAEEECALNGFTKQLPIEKYISAESIKEEEFFQLALALDMSLEDVEEFLMKVLLRNSWDLFNPDEAILYIAFKYVEGNKQEFISKAKAIYKEAKPKKVWKESKLFNTIVYKTQMDQMLDVIEENIMVFDSADDVVKQLSDLFAHMKYMTEESGYQRSANQKFKDLYADFTQYIAEDQKKVIDAEMQKETAEGSVEVMYDCQQGLELSAGQKFYKQDGQNKDYYTIAEDIKEEKTKYFVIKVPVECTEKTVRLDKASEPQEVGYVPGKSIFEHDLIYVTKAHNGTTFRASGKVGSKSNIAGNLTLCCDATQCDIYSQTIPQGTIFKYQGVSFSVKEEVRLAPCVSVKVCGKEEAKKQEITALEHQELYPQIIQLTNTKISYKKAASEKAAQEERLTRKSESAVNKYLYNRASGKNTYDINLNEIDASGQLREKLLRIMKETDIVFSNKINSINEKEATKIKVNRQQLLTMAFLTEMAREQFTVSKERSADPAERLANRMQRINFILNSCGFYGVYPVNLYDCLMLYISTFEQEPMYVYRNLWGNLQDYFAQKK